MRHGQRPAREIRQDPRMLAGFATRPDLTGITVTVWCNKCTTWQGQRTQCRECRSIQGEEGATVTIT
jgi:hypothetical protein